MHSFGPFGFLGYTILFGCWSLGLLLQGFGPFGLSFGSDAGHCNFFYGALHFVLPLINSTLVVATSEQCLSLSTPAEQQPDLSMTAACQPRRRLPCKRLWLLPHLPGRTSSSNRTNSSVVAHRARRMPRVPEGGAEMCLQGRQLRANERRQCKRRVDALGVHGGRRAAGQAPRFQRPIVPATSQVGRSAVLQPAHLVVAN